MTNKGRKNESTSSQRRVLQGYERRGKRFIPPILQHTNLAASGWMNDRVPELIWIALAIHKLGVKDGTAVAVEVARAAANCMPSSKVAFAAASDFVNISEEGADCVRTTLAAQGLLTRTTLAMAALSDYYPDFPLRFLRYDAGASGDPGKSDLNDLKETIKSIIDRTSKAAIFVQAAFVYIHFVNDKLRVSAVSALANFPAVQAYPDTDESREVAASIRSLVIALLSRTAEQSWAIAFWNTGRNLGDCMVNEE